MPANKQNARFIEAFGQRVKLGPFETGLTCDGCPVQKPFEPAAPGPPRARLLYSSRRTERDSSCIDGPPCGVVVLSAQVPTMRSRHELRS
jgi:hypothetical protein